MVNFSPLAAEICWRVWGTPANFNGFRVLASALLHGTPAVGVSQSLRLFGVEQTAPPTFGRAAITLDIGPHCSFDFETEFKASFDTVKRTFLNFCQSNYSQISLAPRHGRRRLRSAGRKHLRGNNVAALPAGIRWKNRG